MTTRQRAVDCEKLDIASDLVNADENSRSDLILLKIMGTYMWVCGTNEGQVLTSTLTPPSLHALPTETELCQSRAGDKPAHDRNNYIHTVVGGFAQSRPCIFAEAGELCVPKATL